MAQTAEEQGFDAFFRSDHFLAIGSADGLPGPTDAWVTLAGIARETSRIRLGHPGHLGYVPPARARWRSSVAEVDAMSGGRVELGLGAGWYEAEHTAYGIPFPPVGERFERLEEQLAIITGLWGTPDGETFSFAGPALPADRQPGPAQAGAASRPAGHHRRGWPAARRLAARYGAELNLAFGRWRTPWPQFDRVRAACEAAGRDPARMVYAAAQVVCCGRDEAEVVRPGPGHRP